MAELIRIPTNENEFSAMVCLAYNIGAKTFAESTALRRLNKGDHLGAASAIEWFNKARVNGRLQLLPGLTRRRAAEKALFLLTPPSIPLPKPTEVPFMESARVLPSEENSGRRETLTSSRTIQGLGTAGVAGGGAAAATAIEKSVESAAENAETLSPQMQRIYQLIEMVPDWGYWLAGAIALLAIALVIYARIDDWRGHRR